MIGTDRILAEKEQRKAIRQEKEELQKQRFDAMANIAEELTQLQSSASSDEPENDTFESSITDEPDFLDEPGPSNPKKSRGKQQVINMKLVATLDKCKVSDRDAVRIIIASAEALGHDLEDLIINRSSIRRYRRRFRKERSIKLREIFQTNPPEIVTIHWDGKMLPCLTGKEQVERLPVIISYQQREKLLGIPAIDKCSGKEQAKVIFQLLEDWKMTEKVQAICCDTTSTNTGRFQGACVILEQMVNRDLLYFPCRHHIYELILKSVFEEKISKSSGPDITLFKRFQKTWPTINKSNFRSGVDDNYVSGKLQDVELKLAFCLNIIKQKQPRGDYIELLELAIIFLGDTCTKANLFHVPGAFHHARWMAKAIYVLKIFLFRAEFPLTNEQLSGIKDVAIFVVNLYIEAWFNASIPEIAPRQDLNFLKALQDYKKVDEKISKVAFNKFRTHLWYLAPECAALSFFDAGISAVVKKRMVENLQTHEIDISCKKIILKDVETISLCDLISTESRKFFNRFNLDLSFLQKDPSVWNQDDSYNAGIKVVKNLKIVNDTAERGVKLMSEYNTLLTKDEEDKQYILQVLEEYKTCYPDSRKSSLIKDTY